MIQSQVSQNTSLFSACNTPVNTCSDFVKTLLVALKSVSQELQVWPGILLNEQTSVPLLASKKESNRMRIRRAAAILVDTTHPKI